MTNKEIVNRNIGLAFDFLKEINSDVSLLDRIPNGSSIEFVEKDFPKKEILTDKIVRKRKYIKVKNEFEVL